MLNNDEEIIESIEVKTPSTLASFADRSINEDEEIAARSDTSSGGSSPSNLKKRLQHLPSSNEAARLANRVINICRHLSQKRDFYHKGATNRIEENVEREEKEEQEILFSKRSLNDIKARDARARRRAKTRLENVRNSTMVISKSGHSSASNVKGNLSEERRSDENSLIENGEKENSRGSLEKKLALRIEPLTNNSQGYSSFSARLPSTRNPYRNHRDDTDSDSSRSQRNASFLRLYSSMSCENSPKKRVELQPRSPVSLSNARPTKFGGYRPQVGVILQNLSSGSEAESNHENTSNRIDSNQRIDRLTGNTIAADNSVNLSDKNLKISNLNDPLPPIPLSSRKSSNHMLLHSSRKDTLESIIVSSVSKVEFTNNQFCKNSKDTLRMMCLSSPRKTPYENSFYRSMNTSRSDCSRNMKNFCKNVEEPIFYSAREDIYNYNRELLETSPSLLETPNSSNFSPRSLEVHSTSRNFHRNMLNLEKDIYNEDARQSDGKVSEERKQKMSASNSRSCVNDKQSLISTRIDVRSPENIFESPMFEDLSNDNLEISSSNIVDSRFLQETMSKCILSYDIMTSTNNDVKSPQSRENTPFSQLKHYASDMQNVALSSTEYFVNDFTENHEETALFPETTKIDQELYDQHINEITNEKEFTNVPTLALNSQEVSYTTSPASKICSERRLNVDSLIAVLSNSSLRQQTTKDTSENSYSESCIDSKTISRPGSSENNLSVDKRLESKSSKTDENQSKSTTSRVTCRSSPSIRSRIPVKIPIRRSKLSTVSKLNEMEESIENQRASLMESERQEFRNDLSSLETLQSERKDQVSGTGEISPIIEHRLITNIEGSLEVVSESSVSTDRKEEDKYPDEKCREDESGNFERTSLTFKEQDQLRASLSLQIEMSDDEPYESKMKEQAEDDQASLDGSNYKESLINRCSNENETSRSSNFPEDQKEHEKNSENTKSEHSVYSDTDSDTSSSSSHCYKIRESVQKLKESEEVDEPEESPNFISRITSITSPLEDYQNKYSNSTYEGEVFDRFVEKRQSNLFEKQIGDAGYRETLAKNTNKLKFEVTTLNTFPKDEELSEAKRVAKNHDKHRFSMEKLVAEQFRRNIKPEHAKSIQSDTTAFFTERFYEVPQFSLACSSSTSKLRHDRPRDSPHFKKKSQDRFPFTISEKTSVASMKFKVPSRLGNLDEDEEEKSYKLDTHPSITRLAGSGFEDSPAEIISYMANTEEEDRRVKSSGMKGLMDKFSARWKKSKRHDDGETKSDTKMTNVLFQNRDYREECESSVDSCSESSLLRDFKLFENFEKKFNKIGDSPDEKPTISDKKSSDRECSGDKSLNVENPCRRYDRDDLWVQAFKNFDSDREEKKKDESNSERDPYSVFFVKSTRETPETSARAFLSEDCNRKENLSAVRKKKNRVKFLGSSLAVAPKRSNEDVHKESLKNKNSERVRRNRNMQSGCLCFRFYRMIVPVSFGSISKYRSQINRNSSSIRKKSRTSLQKKKG